MNKKILIIFVVITIAVIIISGFDIYTRVLKMYYPKTYSETVEKYAKKYEIEEEWIYALIKAESNFEKDSVSKSGAIGLMQLMEKTAKEMADEVRNRKRRFKKCRNKHRTRNEIFCKTNKIL